MKTLLFFALFLLAASSCGSSPAASAGAENRALAEGIWGGPHIQMTIESKGASLEMDCAHGVISKPILVGKDGRFRVSGTYSPEHAGPVRESDEKGRPAVYTGRLEGETLSLGIAYESGEDVGTFELVHGRASRITKCL
jgi:hypothetical protein